MSITLTPPPALATKYGAPRRAWKRDEYEAIARLGILDDARYELIEGDIVAKMPQDRKHLVTVMRCHKWLSRIYGLERIQVQGPVLADNYNEPEPDVAVFLGAWEDYADAPPLSDICLLVEVSNTTQTQDRRVKRAVYARNGAPEYWMLDVPARTLTVFRDGNSRGEFATEYTLADTDTVTPLTAPTGTMPMLVRDLLPPTDTLGTTGAAWKPAA